MQEHHVTAEAWHRSTPGQSTWDLSGTQWHWYRFVSE